MTQTLRAALHEYAAAWQALISSGARPLVASQSPQACQDLHPSCNEWALRVS